MYMTRQMLPIYSTGIAMNTWDTCMHTENRNIIRCDWCKVITNPILQCTLGQKSVCKYQVLPYSFGDNALQHLLLKHGIPAAIRHEVDTQPIVADHPVRPNNLP